MARLRGATSLSLYDHHSGKKTAKASSGFCSSLFASQFTRRRAKTTLLKQGYSLEEVERILLQYGYQPTPVRKSKGA